MRQDANGWQAPRILWVQQDNFLFHSTLRCTCGMLFCATLLYRLKLTWQEDYFCFGIASWQVLCQFRECKSILCSLWMVEWWSCRLCLCQGYVSQQKILEITRMGGLGLRVNRQQTRHATICHPGKDCWIDVAKTAVNQSYESSNLNRWEAWTRIDCRHFHIWVIWLENTMKKRLLFRSKYKYKSKYKYIHMSIWWMFMDVHAKVLSFSDVLLLKRTWQTGRRCSEDVVARPWF